MSKKIQVTLMDKSGEILNYSLASERTNPIGRNDGFWNSYSLSSFTLVLDAYMVWCYKYFISLVGAIPPAPPFQRKGVSASGSTASILNP